MNVGDILFKAPMIRAILEDRKTQTRRLKFKGQPDDLLWVKETFKPVSSGKIINGYGEVRYGFAYRADMVTVWSQHGTKIYGPSSIETGPMQFESNPWKPSIFMPRSASRVTLEVLSVRTERLQDISHNDAVSEGIRAVSKDGSTYKWGIPDMDGYPGNDNHGWPWQQWEDTPIKAFRKLWESINGKGSWAENPEVFVITFKTHKMNIDQFLSQREAA